MLTPEGRVASWNAGAERIKGYKPDEIIGAHFPGSIPRKIERRGCPQSRLRRRERRDDSRGKVWRVRKDGTGFWRMSSSTPIRDDEGALIGFAKITRDITERTRSSKRWNARERALVQSQKMEAIGHLTGGVAHDFNNLLMAVLGSLELVLKRRLPSDDVQSNQLLSNAMQGAQRGAALTQRMLAFARRQELDLKPIDATELIRGMKNLLQSSLGPSVQIETRFPLSVPRISADANQLELAILNLAVNAKDAMPKGGSIVISARERTAQGDPHATKHGRYVCLSVSDTGVGMDETTLARAIEPFYTTKGVGKGTGLGLPMVHGMAEQSGGKLVLKSALGEGTTAELCFPSPKRRPKGRVLKLHSNRGLPLHAD